MVLILPVVTWEEQTVENTTRLVFKVFMLEALRENLKVCPPYY